MRYLTNLATLDSARSAAIASGDIAYLANVLVRAIAFARFTVQCPTGRAETSYAEWCRTGRWADGYLRADRERTIADARTWAMRLGMDTLALPGYELAAAIVRNVSGIGAAKGSFASALMGNAEPACMDIHGMRRAHALGVVDSPNVRDRLFRSERRTMWADYRAIADATFPAGRNDQWAYFADTVPTFAVSGHEVYFRSLGIAR